MRLMESLTWQIFKVCWFHMMLCRTVGDYFQLDKREQCLTGLYVMTTH